jgi:DNA processing protein
MVDLMNHTKAWIALDLIPNIGPKSIQKLLEIFHSPEDILAASASDIQRLGFLNKTQQKSLATGVDEKLLLRAIESLDIHGGHAIGFDDPTYPELLRHIPDPPSVLYIKGDMDDLQPAVGIVGTRSPSHYGKDMAFQLARDLSAMGVSVVSGLARGIDTHAHLGALKGIAKTVGVLGSGIDTIYPPENAGLADKIARKGAIISEFPPGTHPDTGNFPRRNRIISALSMGIVVIEAAYKSGALITARLAGEQGKILMATPGAITNIRSQGPNHLIRQGAVLVRNADDVIMEIAPQIKGFIRNTEKKSEGRDDIIDICAGQEMSIEDIACELHIDVQEITKRISMLELAGKIVKVEGNRFIARNANG